MALVLAVVWAALGGLPAQAASPLQLSEDQVTWADTLPSNPLYGTTGQELLWRGGAWTVIGPAPTSPDDYRIHPGAGLRGNFYARNDSGEPARLGVFARSSIVGLGTKPDDFTVDDKVVRLRMNGAGWHGPEIVNAFGGCVVVAQRVMAPGEVVYVSVDAIMPFGTNLGTSGQLTVTLPEISVSLASATKTGPYTACQMGDLITPEPVPEPTTPAPAPQPSATSRPTTGPVPRPRPTDISRESRHSSLRRGGFADTGIYVLATSYPWAFGLAGAAGVILLLVWRRRSRRDEDN